MHSTQPHGARAASTGDRSPRVGRIGRAARRLRRALRRSRTSICGEGWYYVLVLAFVLTAAMLAKMNLMLVVVGMMLGPLLFSWRLVARTLRGIDVRREIPPTVCAGDLLVVGLRLSKPGKRLGCWGAEVRDHVRCEAGPGRGRAARPTAFFLHVPAGESRTVVYRGRLFERGRYRFGPLEVRTRFPFGLFERRVTLDRTVGVTVFPRLGRLTHAWVNRHHEAFEGTQRRERRHGRPTGEFYGVREWQNGDSRRFIHWRSTARHGALVVRQFEQYRNRDVALLVDLWQPRAPAPDDLENVELAVSFAATVLGDFCRKGGSDVLVSIAGQPTSLGGPASVALLAGAMERLAVAEASPEDRLPELLERTLPAIEPGTEVVLISTRANDLRDADRFASLAGDPALRSRLRRLRNVNSAGESLDEYYRID
jgi:uncharacterized protein (DUF58 family)